MKYEMAGRNIALTAAENPKPKVSRAEPEKLAAEDFKNVKRGRNRRDGKKS